MTRRLATMLVAAAGAAAAVGCSSVRLGAGYEKLESLPGGDPVEARDIYPLVSGEWSFAVTSGTGVGKHVAHRRQPTERFAARWINAEDGRRTEFWRLDKNENIVMPALIDHQEGAITFFNPPLVVAYRDLPAGVPKHQEVAMRVVDLANPVRERETGRARRTIEYVDDQMLKTPLGQFATKRLVVDFTADLRLAEAQTSSTLYVVTGLGSVVIEQVEVIKVLGIPTRRRGRTLVLSAAQGVTVEAVGTVQP